MPQAALGTRRRKHVAASDLCPVRHSAGQVVVEQAERVVGQTIVMEIGAVILPKRSGPFRIEINPADPLGRAIGMPTGRPVDHPRIRRIEDARARLFNRQTEIDIVQAIVQQRVETAERAEQLSRNEEGKFQCFELASLQGAAN